MAVNQKRVGEDWGSWEWEIAEKVVSTMRRLSHPRDGHRPQVEITLIGRGNGVRVAREWSILAVRRSEEARIVQP